MFRITDTDYTCGYPYKTLENEKYIIAARDFRNVEYSEEDSDDDVVTYIIEFAPAIIHLNIESVFYFFRILEKLKICDWAEFDCFSQPFMAEVQIDDKTYCPSNRYYSKGDDCISINNRNYVIESGCGRVVSVNLAHKWIEKDIDAVIAEIKEVAESIAEPTFVPNLLCYKYIATGGIEITNKTNLEKIDHTTKWEFSNEFVDREIMEHHKIEKEKLIKMYRNKDPEYVKLYREAVAEDIATAVM